MRAKLQGIYNNYDKLLPAIDAFTVKIFSFLLKNALIITIKNNTIKKALLYNRAF